MICNVFFVDRENKRHLSRAWFSKVHVYVLQVVWVVASFILIAFPWMVTVKIHKKACIFFSEIAYVINSILFFFFACHKLLFEDAFVTSCICHMHPFWHFAFKRYCFVNAVCSIDKLILQVNFCHNFSSLWKSLCLEFILFSILRGYRACETLDAIFSPPRKTADSCYTFLPLPQS